ncbi:MAG: biopolymer transporter ExbD [Myxococcota bacterium]
MATKESSHSGSKVPAASTGSYAFNNVDQTYVRRSKKRFQHEEESKELNIVPYLDIVMNLIMFLLVTQATMVTLGLIDVTAPTYSSAGPGPAPDPDKKDLTLTIGIAQEGFYIAAKGGVLPGETEESAELTAENVSKRPPTVPKKADGTYDFPALREKLRAIKTVFPDAHAVFLAADGDINYETIVKTLDASREDARGMLFPDVAFSRIN